MGLKMNTLCPIMVIAVINFHTHLKTYKTLNVHSMNDNVSQQRLVPLKHSSK